MGRKRFDGKVVIVTGGATGIGRATSVAFAKEGATVVIADVNDDTKDEVIDQINRNNGKGLFVRTDVTSEKDVHNLFDIISKKYKRLDCAFNNAGFVLANITSLAKSTEEDWDRTLDVNLKGIWLCMKYELNEMLKQGGGAIVNMASVQGISGEAGMSIYCASKHAVVGLTRASALDYAIKNIRINSICPGPIATDMMARFKKYIPNIEKQMIADTPMRRYGTPEEIASGVLWLCSSESSFMIGRELVIDGGQKI